MATQSRLKLSVGFRDLHNRTSELMQAVAEGAELEVTKHGKTIGVMRPSGPDPLYERLVREGLITPAEIDDDYVPTPAPLPPGVTVSDLVKDQRR